MPSQADVLPGVAPPAAAHDDDGDADWIIDPASGSVRAISAHGAEILELQPGAQEPTIVLDGATPAIMLLRRLIAAGELQADRGSDIELLFWTSDGPRTCRCRCRVFKGDALSVAARILDERDTAAAAAATGKRLQPTADIPSTLRRIADRIRADLAVRATRSMVAEACEGSDRLGPPPAPRVDVVRHLGTLAHELRTPLAAISVMSEIMRDARFGPHASPKYAEYARGIHDSTSHLLSVVDAMLTDSTLVTGRATLTFTELDVDALVRKTIEPLLPMATAAGLLLGSRVPAGLPRLIADERSLRQILLNLLGNAVKFTPAGGAVEVAVTANAQELVIVVTDTGPGLEATKAAGTPTNGSGLGLMLSRALAIQNGAVLGLESTALTGTRASLVFPASRTIPV